MPSIAISTGSPPKRRRPRLALVAAAPVFASVLLAVAALASVAADPARADPPLLAPEQAFHFSARALDERTVEARFAVSDGYYLYRDKMAFFLDPKTVEMGVVTLPPGKVKDDPFFGKVDTYRGDVVVRVPLAESAAGRSIVLVSDSQGCADAGVCYPAYRQKVTLAVPAAGKGPGPLVEAFPRKKNWFN